MAYRSLQRSEAVDRFALLSPVSYDVRLDLTGEDGTFTSHTELRFASGAGETFLDLKPVRLTGVTLDGDALDPDALYEGRFPLRLGEGEHLLEVSAVMPFRNDGEGLHRATDPVDGRDYVYGMSFMSAAPSVFACFDQPDLKAPYTFHVQAPADWLVCANAAGEQVAPGQWEFEPSQPLSTYFVTLVAGPYHLREDEHDGIPLALLCRQSLAAALDADADELFTMTKQCFDEFHRLFGIRYPFGKYDQAFVPEFNAGAMENPGLVTFRDPYLFTARPSRNQRLQRATTLAHEMAHQWFGNLTTPKWWDDLWLNEAFAEYMGNRVAAEATQYDDAQLWASLSRKNWGLMADARPTTHPVAGNGAEDADAALQDFDGISYSKGRALLNQFAQRVGDAVFFDGVRDHFERHRFGNATMSDLFASWERAGAGELDGWTRAWLRTAGIDRLSLDREASTLVRTLPAQDRPQDRQAAPLREHALTVATWDGSAWQRTGVVTSGDTTPIDVRDRPAVLDADNTAWADLGFDPVTATALPDLMDRTGDPALRTSLWNTLRNAVHEAHLAPSTALEITAAALVDEELVPAVEEVALWTSYEGRGRVGKVPGRLFEVLPDADGSGRSRVSEAFARRLDTAEAGSELQLAALRGLVGTTDEVDQLEKWLAGEVPEGVSHDQDLRWRVLERLTTLGATDLDRLDRELALADDGQTRLSHAWCHARLATEEAKAWAWQRFDGSTPATNYEIEAIGLGMWDAAQGDLLAPYVDRYFAEVAGTAAIRQGWVLADAALAFYPLTVLDPATVARTEEVCAAPDLNPSLWRKLQDGGDEVRKRLLARALG